MSKEQKANSSKGVRYRLIVIDDETLEKLRSLRVSKRMITFYVLLAVILVAVLTALLIYLTPVRTTVPGYAEYQSNPEFIKISRQVEQMESAMDAQSYYISQLQKLIGGTPPEILDSLTASADLDLTALSSYEDYDEVDQLDSAPQSNQLPSKSISQILLSTPVQGTISAGFLEERNHLGVDIICPLNSPVRSTLSGYVIVADWTMKTGHTIGIQHNNGLVSFYKHNNSLLKQIGDYVLGGEVIAMTGNTGDLTDGPHLHFELWEDGRPVDPTRFISW